MRVCVLGALWLETAAVAGYGLYVAVATVASTAAWTAASAFLSVTLVVLGAGLGLVAAGVVRRRLWARSPVVTWQVLQIAVAVTVFPHQPVPLVLLLAAAVVGLLVVRSDVLPPDDRRLPG